MKTSDRSTVAKLLFFSFRLIFATTQPSEHDKMSTISEMHTSSTSEPAIAPNEADTLHQYTMIAGRMTTPEYIRPIRYTVRSREIMMQLVGIGSDSRRSLSFALYRLA